MNNINEKDDNEFSDSKSIYINRFISDSRCNFDEVRIRIASKKYIRDYLSRGSIKNTDTLNYRTLRPEKGGIFCCSIFGPIDNYKCLCRRYVGESYRGLRCERCSVIVGTRMTRRRNFGHIELNTMVVHPWFITHICTLLGMTKKVFNLILNFEIFIFTFDSEDDLYKSGDHISANQYYNIYYGENLKSGGEAIYFLLNKINVNAEIEKIDKVIKNKSIDEIQDKDLRKREIFECFASGGTSPCDLVLSIIAVIPADLRPIVVLDNGGIATLDINEVYRKIVSRNNRLEKLISLETHGIMINHEKYMLSDSIFSLMGPKKKRNFKSISEYIKGKKGYFRRAALGKRVDFSARGVIVVGPELKIDECSLPFVIAYEIFKPFIYSLMLRRNYVYSLLEAKSRLEKDQKLVYQLLLEIVDDFPILLNRAPTLHRLGIQAFRIKISHTNAIRTSPLVCTAYNADFDGDHMSAHLPISLDARVEAYSLMLSRQNIFSPSNGRLILMPAKDIVMGIYYLTLSNNILYSDKVFSYSELFHIIEEDEDMISSGNTKGKLNYHNLVNVRLDIFNKPTIVVTTYGRLILWYFIPEEYRVKMDFSIFNTTLDKNLLNDLIMYVFELSNKYVIIDLLNYITETSFKMLTKSGISYTCNDMIDPSLDFINQVENEINEMQKYYDMGMMTSEELTSKSFQSWFSCITSVGEHIIEDMKQQKSNNLEDICGIPYNNIYLMYISGSRGSCSQIQQVCGLRGFMARPSGKVGNFIIKSNLKNGLNVYEIFESTHGERKGLSDLAIKTSRAGYLSRKLGEVSHSIIITEEDCGTEDYITINRVYDKRNLRIRFQDMIFGKVVAKNIYNYNGKLLIEKGLILDIFNYSKIISNNIDEVYIYSSLLCKLKTGVCAKCYGMDLSMRKKVYIGTPVGIIASQSIGEPGTQLTMRTTHTGGVASNDSSEVSITSEVSGIVDLSDLLYVVNSNGDKIIIKNGKISIYDKDKKRVQEVINVKHNYTLLVSQGDIIPENYVLAYINHNINKIISTISGKVVYKNIIDNINCIIEIDNDTGIARKKIIRKLGESELLNPIICVNNDEFKHEYIIEYGSYITVQDGDDILAGDELSRLFKTSSHTKDITGGLPKVIDLFEVKKSSEKAVIAIYSGIIKILYSKHQRKNRCISILDPETKEVLIKQNIPINKNILIQDGDKVKIGTMLVDGNIYLQDLLDTIGYEYTMKYMIGEMMSIYEDQGTSISCVHFEVILRQMSKYGIVTCSGESSSRFIAGSYHLMSDLDEEKERILLESSNKDIKFKYKRVIIGITKVALMLYPSFISASSFQHTISRIAKAAIIKARDKLSGIKESFIFCKPIPAGTGFKDFAI